jgi:hypothetical protein
LKDDAALPQINAQITNSYGMLHAYVDLYRPGGDHPLITYEVNLVATSATNSRFTLTAEDDQNFFGNVSKCSLYEENSCFGTTVGFPGDFIGDATREDMALGTWRAVVRFTGPDGQTAEAQVTWEVKWNIIASP